MMTYRAADARTGDTVLPGHVARNAANSRPFQTAFRFRRTGPNGQDNGDDESNNLRRHKFPYGVLKDTSDAQIVCLSPVRVSALLGRLHARYARRRASKAPRTLQ